MADFLRNRPERATPMAMAEPRRLVPPVMMHTRSCERVRAACCTKRYRTWEDVDDARYQKTRYRIHINTLLRKHEFDETVVLVKQQSLFETTQSQSILRTLFLNNALWEGVARDSNCWMLMATSVQPVTP